MHTNTAKHKWKVITGKNDPILQYLVFGVTCKSFYIS